MTTVGGTAWSRHGHGPQGFLPLRQRRVEPGTGRRHAGGQTQAADCVSVQFFRDTTRVDLLVAGQWTREQLCRLKAPSRHAHLLTPGGRRGREEVWGTQPWDGGWRPLLPRPLCAPPTSLRAQGCEDRSAQGREPSQRSWLQSSAGRHLRSPGTQERAHGRTRGFSSLRPVRGKVGSHGQGRSPYRRPSTRPTLPPALGAGFLEAGQGGDRSAPPVLLWP